MKDIIINKSLIKPAVLPIKILDEVESQLLAELSVYDDLVFEESQVSEIKSVVAELNKVEKLIDDHRKDVKKEASVPISAYEKRCNELKAHVNDVRKDFKDALVTIENKRVADKQIKVDDVIDSLIGDIDRDRITFDSKWLNKTTTIKSIKDAIQDQIDTIKKADEYNNMMIESIENYCKIQSYENKVDMSPDGYIYLINTHSLDEIKSKIDESIEIKLNEIIKANSRPEPVDEPVVETVEESEPIAEPIAEPVANDEVPEIFEDLWKIIGTESQFEQLEEYAKIIKIKWEVIK